LEVLKFGLFSDNPDNPPPWGVVLVSDEPLTQEELKRARELAEGLGLEECAKGPMEELQLSQQQYNKNVI